MLENIEDEIQYDFCSFSGLQPPILRELDLLCRRVSATQLSYMM